MVWVVVAIGVAKWTRVRLRGKLDGLCGELGIFCLSMVVIDGEGMMVVTVNMFLTLYVGK